MTTADYCHYYESQMGGQFRVYRGGLQSGAGLGDVLRGILRFIMPVALRGISAFAGNMLAGSQAGLPLALAAKTALGPAMTAAAGPMAARVMNTILPGIINSRRASTAARVQQRQPQLGYDGDPPPAYTEKNQKGAGGGGGGCVGGGVLFDGVEGIPTTDKGLKQYKRQATADDISLHLKRRAKKSMHGTGKRQKQSSAVHFNF